VVNASDWSYAKPFSRTYILQGMRVSGLMLFHGAHCTDTQLFTP
jgi:hypothetical protein